MEGLPNDEAIRAEITPEMRAAAVDILETFGSHCYWPRDEPALTAEEVAIEVWLRMRRIQKGQKRTP